MNVAHIHVIRLQPVLMGLIATNVSVDHNGQDQLVQHSLALYVIHRVAKMVEFVKSHMIGITTLVFARKDTQVETVKPFLIHAPQILV